MRMPTHPLFWARAATAGLLVFWLAGILRAFCSVCQGPDEISYFTFYARNFANESNERGWLWLLFGLDNRIGYGATYWAAYSAFFRLTPTPVACMRAVALVCWLGVPAAILGGGPRQWTWTRMAAAVLYLSTPMAWWTAKLSGPEYISVGLACWGLLLSQARPAEVIPRRLIFGGLIVGLAAGIKLSTAPMLVFAGVWCLCQPAPMRRTAWFSLGVAAGIVLSNPLLIYDTPRFFENITSISQSPRPALSRLRLVLTLYYWQWDGVYCSGWVKIAFSVWSSLWIAAALVVGRLSWREFVPLGVSAAAMIFLLLSNGIFFGWYWFAVIPLLPLLLTRTADQPPWRVWTVVGLALLAAACNLPNTLSMNAQQARQLREHEETLRTMPEITARLQRAYDEAEARGEPPVMILNHLVLDGRFTPHRMPIVRDLLEPVKLEPLIDPCETNEIEVWMIIQRELTPHCCLQTKPVLNPQSPENPCGYRAMVYEEGTVRVYSYRVHSRHADTVWKMIERQRPPTLDVVAK